MVFNNFQSDDNNDTISEIQAAEINDYKKSVSFKALCLEAECHPDFARHQGQRFVSCSLQKVVSKSSISTLNSRSAFI